MGKFLKKIIRVCRPIYWPLVKAYFRFLSPETRGVRVILTHKGEVLFIKNSYGLKYNFPGGNLGKNEDPERGAKREIREEIGIELNHLNLLGTVVPPIEFEYRKNTIFVFTAELPTRDNLINSLEVSDASWFPINQPPSMGHVATQIFEYYKERLARKSVKITIWEK